MNKLQQYFDFYVKHDKQNQTDWYDAIEYGFSLMQKIKAAIPDLDEFNKSDDKKLHLEEAIQKGAQDHKEKIDSIASLLDQFVFRQGNGIGNVKQGVVWDTPENDHKQEILANASPELMYEILTGSDPREVNTKVDELLHKDRTGRDYPAVQNRLMRTLFPDNFGSPDAPNKLERLLNAIRNKLGIDISGHSDLEKHLNLCAEIQTDDPILRQIFTWELFYLLESDFSLKKAICFYGAPGTGKTYHSSREARKLIDAQRVLVDKPVGDDYAIKTVQFHPSYAYEDFMEGIRPNKEGNLELFNGSFKQFCKEQGTKEIQLYTKTDFLKNEAFQQVDFDFARITVNQLNQGERKILGLEDKDYAAGLTLQDAIEPAFFIIDEINRAELSKVFGELMYSLEYRGYRGKIKTQYSHLCQSENDSSSFLWEEENWFFIPQNVYLITTMNNIDRSVDAFDFALRRRFMWKEVHPNYRVVSQLLEEHGWSVNKATSIAGRLKNLNDMIEQDDILDKHYRIGQSYVLELTKLNPQRFDHERDAIQFIWDGFICPLLEEYLKGLGNEQKSREKIEKFRSAFCK